MIALFLAVKRLETATHGRSLIPALAHVSVSTILFLKEFSCSVSVSVCLCAFLFVGSSVCLCAVCLCVRLSICRLSLCPSVYVQSFFVSVFLCAACLCDRLSICSLSLCPSFYVPPVFVTVCHWVLLSVCRLSCLCLSVSTYFFLSLKSRTSYSKLAELSELTHYMLAHSDILYKWAMPPITFI